MKHLSTLAYFCLLFSFLSHFAAAQAVPPCGVDDRVLPDSIVQLMARLPQLRASQQARKAAGEQRVCRVAVEIDSDTYLAYAKDTNQIRSYVLEQMQQVSDIFERDINTKLTVVYIHIWKDTEADPYRGEGDMFKLLSLFGRTWQEKFTHIASDKRIYLPTKATYAAGGVAGGPQAISRLDVPIMAHELGHTFGSPHTHSCSWPGGPIDYCYSAEGSCYTESLESMQGTLMSYCAPRLRTFHPLCQTLMANYAIKNLAVLNTTAQAPVLPAQLTLNNTPFLYWNGQPTASRYDIEVSQTADFSRKLLSDTTVVNGYTLTQLTPGQVYYARVRTVNRLGVSAWSGVCQLQLAGNTGDIPVLLSPARDQTAVPYTSTKVFRVRPVNGATAYEVQLTNEGDLVFSYPTTIRATAADNISTTDYNTGAMRWRARAHFGNRPGPWSTPARFFVSRPDNFFTLPFDNKGPLTFPFNYAPAVLSAAISVVVSTDQQIKAPVYTRTFRDASQYTDVIRGLAPNTTYYLRVEEINTRPDYPAGVLSRVTTSFRTGTDSLASGWSFINGGSRPDWPQGYLSGSLKVGNTGVWVVNDNGLTRLTGDSIQTYSRQSTNGKIGNLSVMVDTDASGMAWAINQTTSTTYNGAFLAPYYQLGKVNEISRSLTDRTFFLNSNYIQNFNADNRLILGNNAVCRFTGTRLDTLYKTETGVLNSRWVVRSGIVWLIKYDYSNAATPSSLVRINLITRAVDLFNISNTPALGKYLNQFVIDGQGVLWVSQSILSSSTPALVRFDGQTWTALPRSSTMPIASVRNMAADALGNLLVIDVTSILYRYNGATWSPVTTVPFVNTGAMAVDNQGAIWFSGQFHLMRYNPCAALATPTLTASKSTIETGESVTLQATGCQNVLWSWTSGAENVANRLLRGSGPLTVKLDSNTTYRAACYNDGCISKSTNLNLTVLPKINVSGFVKRAYCPGDSVGIYLTQQGQFTPGNQISLKLAGQAQLIDLTTRQYGTILTTTLPTSLAAGTYRLFAQSTQPVVRTRDSVQVTLVALPTAELSADKLTLPVGDSSRVSVNLTGASPWSVLDAANRPLTISASPYTFYVKATQPANFTLTLKNLRDANCTRGIVKNELTISALILADEPVANSRMTIFPNPVARQMIIDAAVPITELSLRDMQGREVARQSVTGRHTRFDWALPDLPVGQYTLLVLTTDGNRTHWKIIRH